uniref:Oxy 19a n=1 Tax=Oxyopes heterophthalmus TaxID=2003126 RepID=A0A8D8ERD7_9ARAC|nr:Oxy 19a precursor [Oxyopes heterophthalmus]
MNALVSSLQLESVEEEARFRSSFHGLNVLAKRGALKKLAEQANKQNANQSNKTNKPNPC